MSAERRPLDAYHTPAELADALVPLLPIRPGDTAWEPHAGGGAFVAALKRAGCVVLATDIDPESHFADADDTQVGDCLTMTPTGIRWVVGNPPFRGFEAHVSHALDHAEEVAFLLRLAVMESSGRVALWQRWPLRHVWVLAERPSFTNGSTDSAAYGWFWFSRSYRGPVTITPGWSWK